MGEKYCCIWIQYKIRCIFLDWDFINPPRVYLFEDDLIEVNKRIKHFIFPLPHFSIDSHFTYLNKKPIIFAMPCMTK